MKVAPRLAWLLPLLVLVACSKPVSENKTEPQPAPVAPLPPEARFKKLVEKWRAELSKQGKSDVSYDVRKTDSLVTPLLGIVEILWVEPETLIANSHNRESYHPAKGEVSKPQTGPICKQTVSYALQEDRWVLKDSKVEIANYDKLLVPGTHLNIGEEMTNASVKWRMIDLLKGVRAAVGDGSAVHKALEATGD